MIFHRGIDDSGYQFKWVQVLNTVNANPAIREAQHLPASDGGFGYPYSYPLGSTSDISPDTYDAPRFNIPLVFMAGANRVASQFTFTFDFNATMFLMGRPNDQGTWIPFASVTWGINISVLGIRNSPGNVTFQSLTATPDTNKNFVQTNTVDAFPEWHFKVNNSPSAGTGAGGFKFSLR